MHTETVARLKTSLHDLRSYGEHRFAPAETFLCFVFCQVRAREDFFKGKLEVSVLSEISVCHFPVVKTPLCLLVL